MSRFLNPPSPWDVYAGHVVLWHGCVKQNADAIVANGVDPTRGRPDHDFGRGLYTTTVRWQAESWAWKQFNQSASHDRRGRRPVVLRFRVPLRQLVGPDILPFVVGNRTDDRFWSLVHHCRVSTETDVRTHRHPGRTPPDDWYDVVCGPVAAIWEQRLLLNTETDQYSFHTTAAATILTALIRSGDPDAFRVAMVRRRES
jgi:hypothetical protein